MNKERVDLKLIENEIKDIIVKFKDTLVGMLPGSSGILNSILVDYNGKLVPLNKLAAINNLSQHEVKIVPYDKSIIKNIELAIWNKEVGTVQNVGDSLILTFPPLTLSFYEKLKVTMKDTLNNQKIVLRNVRHKHLDKIKDGYKNDKDGYRKQENDVQNLLDKYNKELEQIFNDMSGKLK